MRFGLCDSLSRLARGLYVLRVIDREEVIRAESERFGAVLATTAPAARVLCQVRLPLASSNRDYAASLGDDKRRFL